MVSTNNNKDDNEKVIKQLINKICKIKDNFYYQFVRYSQHEQSPHSYSKYIKELKRILKHYNKINDVYKEIEQKKEGFHFNLSSLNDNECDFETLKWFNDIGYDLEIEMKKINPKFKIVLLDSFDVKRNPNAIHSNNIDNIFYKEYYRDNSDELKTHLDALKKEKLIQEHIELNKKVQ